MAILTYPKGSDVNLSSNFHLREFSCPCNACTETKIDSDLITKLEAMRAVGQAPFRITSGYRCAWHQDDLRRRGYDTAVGTSEHELGRAADVIRADTRATGVELEKWARTAGFKAVGVGWDWVHVDLRTDKERRWFYTRR